MIAFSVDVLAALSSQVGLILQKLAHRDQELNNKKTNLACKDNESPTKFAVIDNDRENSTASDED